MKIILRATISKSFLEIRLQICLMSNYLKNDASTKMNLKFRNQNKMCITLIKNGVVCVSHFEQGSFLLIVKRDRYLASRSWRADGCRHAVGAAVASEGEKISSI